LAALFIAASAITAYPQTDGLPAEILVKLNEKALKEFPEDARAQDKFISDNENAYRYMAYIPVEKGEESEYAKIKKLAEEKFPLDFVGQSKFMQDMIEGLSIINAYAFAFVDKEEFKKLKAAILSANPEDYKKASKNFEQQANAVLEISGIPKPENLDEEFWNATKLGLSSMFKNDYQKQKNMLLEFSNKMMHLYVFEQNQVAEQRGNEQGPNKWQMQEDMKKLLGDSVLMIQNDKAIGYFTTINDKDVVIFPSEAYDARGISITNKVDERIVFGDVLACKDLPVSIAFVRSIPEGMHKINIGDEAFIRSNVNKETIVYSFEMRNDYVLKNKLSAMGAKYLNMATRLSRTVMPGSIVLDEEGKSVMGMVVNQSSVAEIGNLTNKEDAKHLLKQLNKEVLTKIVVRLDKLQNWEKIDPVVYQQQADQLNTLQSRNEQYLAFFTAARFSALEDKEVFRSVYEKYSTESKTKYEKTAQERMVRDMLSEILSNMRRETAKLNPAQMYVSLQDSFEFNLKIRQKMIDTLDAAIKNKTYMNYYFDDLKPKGR
jgi:hypothetical protein